jgi:hypothetical protein
MDQSFGNLGAGAGSSSGGSNSKAAVSSSSFLQLPLSTAAAASPAYYGSPLALLHHHAAAGGPSSQQQQQLPYAKHASAEMSAAEAEAIKDKIVAHPQYSALLAAYLDCQKVLSLSFHPGPWHHRPSEKSHLFIS